MKGLGKPKELRGHQALDIVNRFLIGMLAGDGFNGDRGAGRVQGQRIKRSRRSKNGPAHQGNQECARRVRHMERAALKLAA